MKKDEKTIHIGCGCLTDIIALILFAIFCDLIGCSWSHGFSDKLKRFILTDQTILQLELK